MNYTNVAKDTHDLISLLKARGLGFRNEPESERVLQSVSYFRLACYWRAKEVDAARTFEAGCWFEDFVELYLFDKELRSLVFRAIQDVEIALRSRIVNVFSMAQGAFWFMDASQFVNVSVFAQTLSKIQEELGRSNEEFLSEHSIRYSSPSMPPAWKTLEVASFGTLSKMYKNFSDVRAKKLVARSFGLPQYTYLESWIRSIAVLRNCCAHHARVWNRRYAMMPQIPARLPLDWVNTSSLRPQKLYPQLCILAYLEQSITPSGEFVKELKSLLGRYPMVDSRAMGFPSGWETEPLWR